MVKNALIMTKSNNSSKNHSEQHKNFVCSSEPFLPNSSPLKQKNIFQKKTEIPKVEIDLESSSKKDQSPAKRPTSNNKNEVKDNFSLTILNKQRKEAYNQIEDSICKLERKFLDYQTTKIINKSPNTIHYEFSSLKKKRNIIPKNNLMDLKMYDFDNTISYKDTATYDYDYDYQNTLKSHLKSIEKPKLNDRFFVDLEPEKFGLDVIQKRIKKALEKNEKRIKEFEDQRKTFEFDKIKNFNNGGFSLMSNKKRNTYVQTEANNTINKTIQVVEQRLATMQPSNTDSYRKKIVSRKVYVNKKTARKLY